MPGRVAGWESSINCAGHNIGYMAAKGSDGGAAAGTKQLWFTTIFFKGLLKDLTYENIFSCHFI